MWADQAASTEQKKCQNSIYKFRQNKKIIKLPGWLNGNKIFAKTVWFHNYRVETHQLIREKFFKVKFIWGMITRKSTNANRRESDWICTDFLTVLGNSMAQQFFYYFPGSFSGKILKIFFASRFMSTLRTNLNQPSISLKWHSAKYKSFLNSIYLTFFKINFNW